MAMAKKGLRKIVVRDKTFYYKVTGDIEDGLILHVNNEDRSSYCKRRFKGISITPAVAEKYSELEWDFLVKGEV